MTVGRRFNLVDDPWIPFGGREVSLVEALTTAHELPGWPDGEPGFAAVLMRMLTVVAYRVTGLDSPNLTRSQFAQRQRHCFEHGRFDAEQVGRYFDECRGRFWLLGPPEGQPPFAQDVTLSLATAHPVAKVVNAWASGNNPSLVRTFNMTPSRQRSPQDSCWSSARMHRAAFTRNTPSKQARGSMSRHPCRRTMSLHPVGATFAATLIGHLVPLEVPSAGFGEPFWEAPPPVDPVAPHAGIPGLLEHVAGRQDKTMLLRFDGDGAVTGFTISEGPGSNPSLVDGSVSARRFGPGALQAQAWSRALARRRCAPSRG